MRVTKINKKWLILVLCVAALLEIGNLVYDFRSDTWNTRNSIESNNKKGFFMKYEWFDGTREYSMALEEGDTLKVDILSESGKLDLLITEEDNEESPLYRGTDIQTSTFSLPIKETGTYQFKVDAQEHKGSYSIDKNPEK